MIPETLMGIVGKAMKDGGQGEDSLLCDGPLAPGGLEARLKRFLIIGGMHRRLGVDFGLSMLFGCCVAVVRLCMVFEMLTRVKANHRRWGRQFQRGRNILKRYLNVFPAPTTFLFRV